MTEAVDQAGARELKPVGTGRKQSSDLQHWADVATRAALSYAGVVALFATPLLAARAAVGSGQWVASLLALSVAATVLVGLLRARSVIAQWATAAWVDLRQPNLSWLWYCMAAGIVLRLAWLIAFPAAPMSDGATYLMLARRLASGERYEMEGTLAYWPPGYPIWLAAWLAVVGNERLAIAGSNLVLFALGFGGVWRAASAIAGVRAAFLAAVLFALWPNHVAYAGVPEKEQLLVAILPWMVVLLTRAVANPWRAAPWLGAGAMAGAGALVQPSLLLFPLLVLAFALTAAASARQALVGTLLLVGAMVLIIAPWTVRNYQVLGAVIPVTTSGGSNFYRANNPLATGGYVEKGEIDLSNLPEVEADRVSRRLAVEWIAAHPVEFIRLGLWKQVLFMGDDAAGVYTSVRLGKGSSSTTVYAALKLAANATWMAYWAALLLALLQLWRRRAAIPAAALLPAWLFLYFFGLHSVFESAGKYHVALIGVLPVMLIVYAARAFRRESA